MSAFQKVLVVDDGIRPADRALSIELGELGYASVTVSLDAVEDVLAIIPSPAAILFQLPRKRDSDRYDRFLELAERLKAKEQVSGVPIIMLDHPFGPGVGGFSSALEEQIGCGALNQPDR
jgi:CheY-like chemotaxis protein